MSLYNLVFGRNPMASLLLALAGLDAEEIPRFRDVFILRGDNGEPVIQVYTRTGGGNREAYESENDGLAGKPNAIRDYDDDFDSTYAYFEFSPIEGMKSAADVLLEAEHVEPASVGDMFQDLVRKMETGNEDDPAVRRALDVGRRMLAQITQAMDEKQPA